MMKRFLLTIASAAGLMCLAGTPAWASPSPTPDVSWSYNFTPSQSFIKSDTGGGSVSFTNEPTHDATNSSDVVVTNLKVSSTASNSNPDSFTGTGGKWSVNLQLTDKSTGQSTSMTFTGQLGGTFSQYNANITNTFTGNTTQSWTDPQNGNKFTVSLIGFTPPGPPSDSNAGSIAAYVQVTPGSGNGHTGGTPEPSTLVLSSLGLSFASLASWRKRCRSLATILA